MNGQNVIAKNIEASNGIIHLIDGVLLRPAPSIADAAIGTPALSTLVAAVVKAGLVETLDETGPFTVFAPTNDAFAAAGIDPDAVDVETLTAVLLDHVVPGTFSEDQLRDLFATGGKLTTLGGLTLEFDEARHNRPFERAGATIFGRRPLEVNDLLVQATNIGTSNGNVFVIDGVLLR
ncbi:MAG: fasciclin domain-containing protein [Acidobacteria bacterium]|nr:fasciclin domain-containing protein [Acidobacteriota bacterium]